jgi:hypothetical protein
MKRKFFSSALWKKLGGINLVMTHDHRETASPISYANKMVFLLSGDHGIDNNTHSSAVTPVPTGGLLKSRRKKQKQTRTRETVRGRWKTLTLKMMVRSIAFVERRTLGMYESYIPSFRRSRPLTALLDDRLR